MVLTQVNKNSGIIKLNRPEKRNALNPEMISALREAFAKFNEDNAIKSIILTGEGKAFCAGADLEYLARLQKNALAENRDDSKLIAGLFRDIYNSRKIIIAAVNGPAIAGGCGLASVCDFIFADINHSKFGYSEVKIGFIAAIVSIFLIKRIGEAKARQLLLTADIIDAEKALLLGLVDFISEDTLLTALEFASKFDDYPDYSISLTKNMISSISSMDINEALNYCSELNAFSRSSEDFVNGLKSFLHKKGT